VSVAGEDEGAGWAGEGAELSWDYELVRGVLGEAGISGQCLGEGGA
jgi:hypothetical protein